MNGGSENPGSDEIRLEKQLNIRIFGVGNAGVALLEQLNDTGLQGTSRIAINTDASALGSTAAQKVHLETRLLRGLGTGGDPDRGKSVAESSEDTLKALVAGADVVFILAGLGGGAGSGISPVLARIATEAGALVLGFVTTPFDCEGKRRQGLAQQGLEDFKAASDGVICLPNQKVLKLIDENTSVLDTFKKSNELLAESVMGVWRLLAHRGLIEIRFEEIAGLLRGQHAESACATAQAAGPGRSREVIDRLFAHPMLECGQIMSETRVILVSLMGGADLTMAEVNRVMEGIQTRCEHAQVIMGAAVDERFRDALSITLIAGGKPGDEPEAEAERPSRVGTDLPTHLLTSQPVARTGSRFVPPPPGLPPEQMKKFLSQQNRTRVRKTAAKMRQGDLPLDIVSKGRFDKSEPTIHHGEDLDVPTYIRRGICLN
jgi:cell division protein FtsZ